MRLDLSPVRDAWAARSPRERVLLAVMCALIAALVLWYGLASPLLRGAEDARREREAAAERLARVEAGATLVRRLAASAPTRPAAEVEMLVVDSAAQSGLRVDRRRTESDGVTVWLDAATAPALFAWMDGLQTRQVAVRSFAASRGASGTVQAEVRFAGG